MSIQINAFSIPCPGVQKKVIYHFSDLHLALVDPTESPEQQAAAQDKARGSDECRFWFAAHCKEPFDESVSAAAYFEQLLAACGDGDAVLCAGDLVEHPNAATLRFIEEKTAGLPFLTICGNHDPIEKIPDGYAVSAAKEPVQEMDLGDLRVLAFDDSRRVITPDQLAALETALAQDTPLIILLHIPFAVAENEAMLRGCGEYFMLNYDGCPAENHRFVQLIQANPHRIVAVLAGHLHFNHTCSVAEGLTQYVSSQGMAGHLNRYVIGE